MKRFGFMFATVLIAAGLWRSPAPAADAAPTKWTCAMHPQIVRDRPGDCPICGMRLIPLRDRPIETPVPGEAVVTVPKAEREELGVTLGRVTREGLVRTLRVPGRVAHDPELYSALTEYRSAKEAVANADNPRTREALEPMLEAAKLKVAHFGFAETDMDELASSEHAEHLILPGSHVWVYASVFEQDLRWVAVGQRVRVTVPALPGEVFAGSIRAIEPMLDPETRTATVRILVQNSGARGLKLEMFATVSIEADLGTGLTVPKGAVIDTGVRQLVFVNRGDDLVPRRVTLGPRVGDRYQVLAGLHEGDEVVTSANFMIDADSQIRAAAAPSARTGTAPASAMPGMDMGGGAAKSEARDAGQAR